jgi:basic membrane protein A and related proteins
LRNSVTTAAMAALLASAVTGGMATSASAFTACQVTDSGGVDDKSFNETAWEGAQQGAADVGGEAKVLESQSETDYVPNINSFLAQDCDVIITVGFLLGDATKAAAEANPDRKFAIIDVTYDPVIPNVLGSEFATEQGGFLAGYLSAGISKTGVVGTFGGINIGHGVTGFMDGFVWGVQYYNEQKGTDVQVLGWDPAAKEGLFTGNFSNLDDGRTFAQNLNQEGADIVLPVAGPVGLGSAALAAELGTDTLKIIGVDADQYLTDPDHGSVYLTSILKQVNTTAEEAIKRAADGTFEGGALIGTLENGGVGLAPFHDLDGEVSAEMKAELDTIRKGIIDGSIKVGGM